MNHSRNLGLSKKGEKSIQAAEDSARYKISSELSRYWAKSHHLIKRKPGELSRAKRAAERMGVAFELKYGTKKADSGSARQPRQRSLKSDSE